ncbi:MAG: FtsX-like permease family protein, partial [Streptosporangiaceae bacterium]
LGVSFLFRRARSSWLLLTCVAVTVLLATGLAAVLWTFSGAVIPLGAQGILAGAQSRVVALSGEVDASEAAADSQQIRAALGKAWPGVGYHLESALWSAPLLLSSSAGSTAITQIQPASLAGISAQATLTAGTWPGPPRPGGPVPVALPAAAASQLHVGLGSVLTGAPASGGTPTSLQVTGLFRPTNPASTYWALDLLPISGIDVRGFASSNVGPGGPGPGGAYATYGPAVVDPASFGGALTVSQGSWMVLPQAPAMARGNLDTLSTGTSAAVSQLTVLLPDGLNVTSSLPQILAGIASTIVLTRSLFTIAALLLLLVAGAGLVLAARLLASLREEESALLRARGATRWQVVRPVLAEAVLLGAAAGLAGVLAGTRLTSALARLANLRLDGYTGRGIAPLAWLSALAMLVLCAAVMAWPALHAPAPDAARLRRGRQARLAGITWAGGDLALVALAAVAVWELRGYSAVAHPASGSLGIDPVVALAPALALAGVAIIPLRGLPLLARLADKATDRERRLAAALVSWQIARRPIRQAGPVLLVVIATATTTLALAGYASWRQSTADQAAFAVGSDVRVDSAGPLPLGATGAINRAPGVTAATEASLADIVNAATPSSLASADNGTGGQLIALDASTAGQTILLRPDLSPLSLSALWQRITPQRRSGLALPGQPDRLEVRATLGAGPGTSAAKALSELGSISVTAWIQDAGGATYGIPANGSPPAGGGLPVDGKAQSLVFTLSGPRQASYPLRLLGLTLGPYPLPPYDPARPNYAPAARLTVESLAVAATASGPFGRPFGPGAAMASWRGAGSATDVPVGPPSFGGGIPPADGAGPAILGWRAAAGGGQQLTFGPGHDPSVENEVAYGTAFPVDIGQVGIAAPSLTPVLPVIAT